jgi:hypothetical protein
MRMHMRPFARLTNAFSKEFVNRAHMAAMYAVWYNWIRIHKTLRVTPAMAAESAQSEPPSRSAVAASTLDRCRIEPGTCPFAEEMK